MLGEHKLSKEKVAIKFVQTSNNFKILQIINY